MCAMANDRHVERYSVGSQPLRMNNLCAQNLGLLPAVCGEDFSVTNLNVCRLPHRPQLSGAAFFYSPHAWSCCCPESIERRAHPNDIKLQK